MLRWALVFLVIAVLSGVVGVFGFAGAASGIFVLFFYIPLMLSVSCLMVHLARRA